MWGDFAGKSTAGEKQSRPPTVLCEGFCWQVFRWCEAVGLAAMETPSSGGQAAVLAAILRTSAAELIMYCCGYDLMWEVEAPA